jgi:hypothetical protein
MVCKGMFLFLNSKSTCNIFNNKLKLHLIYLISPDIQVVVPCVKKYVLLIIVSYSQVPSRSSPAKTFCKLTLKEKPVLLLFKKLLQRK